MATGAQVLVMLCPDKEWVMYGEDFDSVQWIKGEPITRAEFEAGFSKYDAWKAAQDAIVPTPAEKLFNATGLTVAEYKALGL